MNSQVRSSARGQEEHDALLSTDLIDMLKQALRFGDQLNVIKALQDPGHYQVAHSEPVLHAGALGIRAF